MPIGNRVKITVPPGVSKDDISYTSILFDDSDKIRFYRGYPQVIGGWQNVYDLWGEPDINYILGPNPIAVTENSDVITLSLGSIDISLFNIGDLIKIKNVIVPIGGIQPYAINGIHVITYVGANYITFYTKMDLSTEIRPVADDTVTAGGGQGIQLLSVVSMDGVTRSIFTFRNSAGKTTTLFGTNSKLYAFQNDNVVNITPLQSTTIAIPNSLASNYYLLSTANPIATLNGSATVTVTLNGGTVSEFVLGDTINVSGVSGAIAGIAQVNLNGIFTITNVNSGAGKISYVNSAGTLAGSTTTGGGSAVTIGTQVITVTQNAHGYVNGRQVTISGASGFAGFTAADINTTALIRNKTTNTYDYITAGDYSTVQLISQGGFSTVLTTADTTALSNNALTTNYYTLSAANPISTTIHSTKITVVLNVSSIAHFVSGDTITIGAVASDIGGIPLASINGVQVVGEVNPGTNTITFFNRNADVATSSASGGGTGTVTLSTQVMTVAQTSHGYATGDVIHISGATTFAGIVSASNINVDSDIRNVATNTYDYLIQNEYPTSSASGGGANITVQTEIIFGSCDVAPSDGYGGGPYGAGPYGEGAPFPGYNPQTIWSFDRFGNNIVMTPGDQSPIYIWDGILPNVPTLLSAEPGAVDVPPYVNWILTGGNQLITFGATSDGNDGSQNLILTSSSNQVANFSGFSIDNANSDSFFQVLEDSGRLISAAFVKDQILVFSENNVKSMTFVGGNETWLIRDILTTDGLIAPKAVVSLNDAVFWIGKANWYVYNGAIVNSIPNNPMRQWFYDNINDVAAYKSFVSYNASFNEVWVFFPLGTAIIPPGFGSSPSLEPNTYIIWNYIDNTYANGNLTRTAAENYTDIARPPYFASGNCNQSLGEFREPNVIYEQELNGYYRDDGGPIVGSLATSDAILGDGQFVQSIERIIPSNIILPIAATSEEQGRENQERIPLYDITMYTKIYDGDPEYRVFGPFAVTTGTDKIEVRANGRQWYYVYNFSTIDGFRIQDFYAELKPVTLR